MLFFAIYCNAGEFLGKQTGTATISGTSIAVSIDAVCMAQSFLVFSATTDDNDPGDFHAGGEITDESTLTFYKFNGAGSSITIKWQVFEFASGVSVQHGSTTGVTGTTNVALGTAVTVANTFVIASGRKDGATLGNDDGYTVDITSTTNLQLIVAGGTYTEVYWQVIEYADATVKKVTASLTGGSSTTTSNLTTQTGSPVSDMTKTMVISNHTISANIFPDDLPRTELTDANTVTYTRAGTGGTLNFVTFVVEFTDNTTVERGLENFPSGDISEDVSISATSASSGVFGPGQFGRQGSTDSPTAAPDDNPGYAWFTYEITGSTNLRIERAIGTGSVANAPYEIVTFEDSNPANTTYYSFATGNWDDNASWTLTSDGSSGAVGAGIWPSRNDNVVVRTGHTITVNAVNDNNSCGISPDELNRSNVGTFTSSGVSMFYHTGDVIVDAGGTYSSTLRSMYEGYTYVNGTFTSTADIVNLGNMEVTSIATFNTDDDIVLSGNSFTVFDNTSTSDDDIYIDHTDALLCGKGTFNVGNGGADPTIQYLNGATESQICSTLTITCTSNCGGFSAPGSPGTFSLGYTGPGGVGNESNVGMWFKADDLSGTDGSTIPTWADASGNGNDATQGTAGREPLFYNTSSMNNMPIVRFDGTNDEMTVADADILDNSSGLTIFAALRPNNLDGSPRGILGKRLNSGTPAGYSYTWFFFTTNYLNTDIDTQNDRFTTNPTTYTNANNYILGLVYDGTLAAASRANIYEEETNVVTSTESSASIPNGGTVLTLGALNASYGTYLGADYGDVIQMNVAINSSERIIINNYLSAKYAIALSANNVYEMDDAGNGDFDYEVAGIGQASDGSFNKDAKGSGLVRMNLASDLDNDEFLMWGHDGTAIAAVNTTDVDGTIIEARLERVWRVSENDNTGAAVDVGTVRLTFDGQNLPASIVGSDIRLLITRDDALFIDNDVPPQAGSYNIDDQLITFSGVSFQDGDYFTLGTIDNTTSPLPIELIDFSAKPTENGFVKLEWATASEENNDYFTVERSENSINWGMVATIEGKGTIAVRNDYSMVDDNPYTGISYYRLKQTDFDGSFTYSAIKSVQIDSRFKLKIYPNPSKGSFIVRSGFDLENVTINVIDLTGRRIQSTVSKDQFSADVQLPNSPPGIYILELNDGIRVYKSKVLIDY